MADESQEDLDKFLTKVDDIHRLVQNLSSNDTENVAKAMEESDKLLKETSTITGVNRTVINKSSSDQQQVSPDAFMQALEKDAQERAENRRKNKIIADEWKSKGNDAFHQQLYDQAIEYYTEGLKIKKDYDILYTNRAQVYVKQERYKEAIEDCEWALKVTPTLIKAFVIKGKCLMNLKEFDRAKEVYLEAEQIAKENFESTPTRRMLEECLNDVQRQHQIFQCEESARIFLSNEDPSKPMNLTNTLKKLTVNQQPIIYYIGGIDLLCQLITDETTRTAFRVNNGFDLFNNHSILVETTDTNLFDSIFKLMINLSEDDENAKQCLNSQYFRNYLIRNSFSSIAFEYLIEISLKNHLRNIFMHKIDSNKFIQYLLNIIKEKKNKRIYAMKLLSNLAVETKIKQYFNNKNEIENLIEILKSSLMDEQFRNVIYSLLTNLCAEKTIRLILINQIDLFEILINDLDRNHQEYQLNLLGLLINLTNEKNQGLERFFNKFNDQILTKLKVSSYHQRVFTFLGNLIMHYEEIVEIFIRNQILQWISRLLQKDNTNEETIRAGVRLLALCTQTNRQAQEILANDQQILTLIYEQFLKSQHSLLIGNASLLFGNLVRHLSTRIFLEKTIGIEKIIDQLLKLVEESWLSKAARKNLAIFLTKLVKADENFLQEFRKQHGTEILHSALKDVEL